MAADLNIVRKALETGLIPVSCATFKHIFSGEVGMAVSRRDDLRWTGSYPGGRGESRLPYREVRDNGSGLRQELFAKIFDPFFITKFIGRGLGPAAVHSIVRSNQGFIEVESASGHGTAFRVYLPAGRAPPNRPRVTRSAQRRQRV